MTRFCQGFSENFSAPPSRIMARFGRPFLWCFLFTAVFASLVVYLLEINTISTKGFRTKDLEKQIEDQKNSNEKLSLRMVELQSMGELKKRVDNLNMVVAADVVYLDYSLNALARK